MSLTIFVLVILAICVSMTLTEGPVGQHAHAFQRHFFRDYRHELL